MTDKRTPSSQMRKTKMAHAIQMSNRRNAQIIITNKAGTQREQTKAQQSPLLMMFCQRFSMRALSYRPAQYTMASLHSHRSKRSANSSYNWIIQATLPVNCARKDNVTLPQQYNNNNKLFYGLFFQTGAHSPLQCKEPKDSHNKLSWTHTHAQ